MYQYHGKNLFRINFALSQNLMNIKQTQRTFKEPRLH